MQPIQHDTDPFGIRKLDLTVRVPEKSEMFTREEAMTYIQGCDFPESVDDLLLAWEIDEHFGPLGNKTILDAMCGPGRLGRELMQLGTHYIVFHDGDHTMMAHAKTMAEAGVRNGQMMHAIISPVDKIALPANMFDLVVCHNSTHQLESIGKLHAVIEKFLHITKPGGFIVIADYQRNTTPEFIQSLEERLTWTKPEIIPLLVPTFTAAFSKSEFADVFASIPGIARWQVVDAALPTLTTHMQERVIQDPVKGHVLDFSPISLRAIAQKEEV